MEETIKSLSPDFADLDHDLDPSQIHNLAPTLLGAVGAQQVDYRAIFSWPAFKLAVDKVFGLSREQLMSRFYAMRPGPGELSERFAVRLDHEVRVLGVMGDVALNVF